jgi:septum formation topological specificity factor MinE
MGGDGMSEFKKELMTLIHKYYPDYEYIEIKVNRPPDTFSATIDVRVME